MGILRKLFGLSPSESAIRVEDHLPFAMPIEDVFTISGYGTVVTGTIESGKIKVGDDVEVLGGMKPPIKTQVMALERSRRVVEKARTGENVGCLLRAVKREMIERGQVLVKPA